MTEGAGNVGTPGPGLPPLHTRTLSAQQMALKGPRKIEMSKPTDQNSQVPCSPSPSPATISPLVVVCPLVSEMLRNVQ